ncbi:MAG: hypothetical protein LBI80_01220 [Endomicrobium sp.]|jgi:hypothetical protein|nr:hypothetical protein [Endomicrobium sp.]
MLFFRYIKYIVIPLIIISGVYMLRESLFSPSIKRYLSSKAAKEIDFENFYITPFSLTVTNVKVADIFFAKEISFDFHPMKFIINSKSPIKAVSKIKASNVEVVLDKKNSTIKNKTDNKSLDVNIDSFNFDIFIDKIVLKNNYKNINFYKTYLGFKNENIDIISSLNIDNFSFDINSKIQRKNNKEFNTLTTVTSQDKLIANIVLDGNFDTNCTLYQNIKATELKYKGLDFSGFEGIFYKNLNSISLDMQGVFGKLKLLCLANNVNIDASLYLMKINKNLNGDIKLKASVKDNSKDIKLDVKNLSIFNLGNANLNFDVAQTDNGIYSGHCNYEKNKKIYVKFSRDGSYEKKIIVNNKEVGAVVGNIKKGTIKTDIKNVKLSDLPLKFFFNREIDGVINLYGEIDGISGQIDFSLNDFANNKKLIGIVTKNNDVFVLNLCDINERVLLNTVIKKGKIISSDFKFIKIDTLKLFNILGYDTDKFSGIATGRIKYQKDTFLDFKLKVFDGYFYKNSFKKFDLRGNINSDEINIEHCVLINHFDKELINMKGVLGFSEKNLQSFVVASIKNLKIGFLDLTSYVEFKGISDNKKAINGILKISSTTLSGADLDNISAEIKISDSEIKLYNLKSDQDIKASGTINLKDKQLSANLECKNLNINGFYKNFSGFLTLLVNISGNLSNPNIDISADVTNGRYFTLPFSLFTEIKLKNKVLMIDKAKLLSNRTDISLKGDYTGNSSMFVKVKNLDEKIINAFVGFRTPLKINFFGEGNISLNGKNPNCKLFLNSKVAYVKNLKINDVKCNLEVKNSNIYLKEASCNISDSQVKADKGFFNLSDKTYGLDLFLVNVRASFADFLGNISLLGRMVKSDESYEYVGSAKLINFWISKHKINSLALHYHIKNKTLEFYQQDDNKNGLKVSAMTVFGDVLSIRKLNILKDETVFDLCTDISQDFINLNFKGVNLESKILTDIFNCGDLAFGKSDINLNLLGYIKNPKGKLQVNSKNGFLMDVPYDSLNVVLTLENNRVNIDKANILKKNELQVSVKGGFPFYLKKDLTDRQNQIDIFYEINDHKLSILKYVSLGFVRPFSGKMFLKGTFTGNLDKINSNAKLSISGASLELKEYLKKVKNMNVDLTLVNNLLAIDNFSLKSSSGKLNIYGNVRLNNFDIDSFDVRLVTTKKGIPIRIPQLPLTSFVGSKSFLQDYSFGEPSFDIRLGGNLINPRISGKIILENTRFTYPGASKSHRESMLPDGTYIDLDFVTAKNTRFENSYVSALINGSVHLYGYFKNLKANGIVDSLYGTINYLGIIFDVSNARLEIMSQEIYLTLTGETSVSSKVGGLPDIIKLTVNRSKLSELFQPGVVRVSSKDNPNMDAQKVLEKISGLDEQQDIMLKVSDSFGQQTVRLLNQTLATPFAKAMLRKTGLIDNFKVSYIDARSPNLNNANSKTTIADLMSGTKYSLEKNITNQTLLGYSITFDEFNEKLNLKHSLEMRYKLTDNLYFSGNYDLDSKDDSYQADKKIMIQQQIRFGGPSKKTK